MQISNGATLYFPETDKVEESISIPLVYKLYSTITEFKTQSDSVRHEEVRRKSISKTRDT